MSTGTIVSRLVDIGTEKERVVVDVADFIVLASPELIAAWRGNDNGGQRGTASVEVLEDDREVVLFGTDGEGVGRVCYGIEEPAALISTEPEHLRPISDFYTLVRLA